MLWNSQNNVIPYLFDLAPNLEFAPTSNKRPPKKVKNLISAQGAYSNKYGKSSFLICFVSQEDTRYFGLNGFTLQSSE